MRKIIFAIFYRCNGFPLWHLRFCLLAVLYISSLTIQPAHALGHPVITDVVSVGASECPDGISGYTACYKYSWEFVSDDVPGSLFYPKGKFDVLVNSKGNDYLQTNAPWSFGVPSGANVSWSTLIQTMVDKAGRSGEGLYSALITWKGCFTFGVSNNATSHPLPGAKCFRSPPPDVSCNFNLEKINIDFGSLNPKMINGVQQSVPVTLTCSAPVTAIISNLDNGSVVLHNEINNDGITADLGVNGSSLEKELNMDLAAGDNVLNIMATLKSDGNISAGDYSASTLLSVSLQ
ncbi:hypothetical protein MUA01_09695 [Enterobacteriaceae bacterium H18W14]|uniref:MrpH family fimbial adhesin n=1 Tax=Dryocola boscaweniae TaxID=2925397 RepID=UPI0022F0C5FE|nr:hypothetical protein [Dryocola boscaweniae]MCT4715248.1 hypothetical protein [Dryocola boscaweniae]